MITIPARRGIALALRRGQRIAVINTHGEQVVDTWAFAAGDTGEFMSMEHTRATLCKLVPAVGDALVTNHRRPILALTEDTTPGTHDTLMAACDSFRYALLGHVGYHDNCTDNLATALAALGLRARNTPCPLNLFMNIPWTPGGALAFEPPRSQAGQQVVLRAEMDCTVAFSACPQDLVPVNGRGCRPTDAHCRVLD